jgi:hypothetical protein
MPWMNADRQRTVKKHLKAVGLTDYVLLDWLCVILLHIASNWLENTGPWYIQDESHYADNEAYLYPHLHQQRVSYHLLNVLTYWVPLYAFLRA